MSGLKRNRLFGFDLVTCTLLGDEVSQIPTFWCYPQDPCHKVSIFQCVPWAGNTWRRRTQWSPVLGREATLRPWGKTLPELAAPVWDRASATSRPCHMAVAFLSATLRLAGVRLLWPALSPMGGRISSLLRRWAILNL